MKRRFDQSQTPLFTAMKTHCSRTTIHMDVPGHKQGAGARELREYYGETTLRADLNSMYGMDNLLSPSGVIMEAERLAADLFGADAAYFLVNGTTSAIQTMILAACKPGDKIIIPRNVHKSVINALILSGAVPIYVQPEFSTRFGLTVCVSAEEYIKTIEENQDAKAVLVINPTYYGFVCDIKTVCDVAHSYGMMVLADEAHGTHLYFHDGLPIGAMDAGADMAGLSVHKTGGSFTQSSILLLSERYLSRSYVKTIANLTHTTSASYLLMSSLDVARKQLAENGEEMIQRTIEIADEIKRRVAETGLYHVVPDPSDPVSAFGYDKTKVVLNLRNLDITGVYMFDLLAGEYDIYVEFGDADNILLIPGIGSTFEEIPDIVNALEEIGRKHYTKDKRLAIDRSWFNVNMIFTPRNSFYKQKKRIPFQDAVGQISAEFVMFYPPGIPILAPGELITKDAYDYIMLLLEENATITGIEDPTASTINVIVPEDDDMFR
ncbi:MAG TPA: arginine decarboxylase [Clostridiales bacterium]|nr:arginine decarboxylase [Clostridiales bacterium]